MQSVKENMESGEKHGALVAWPPGEAGTRAASTPIIRESNQSNSTPSSRASGYEAREYT